MARGKKKENLTPEERLQAALVPESEQPYKVPENWCWVRFGKIINLISGRDAKLTDCNSLGIGIPYILGASNLENNVFTIERWIENPQVISLKNDVLLSVKGTIGKVYLQKEEKINISRQIMAIRSSSTLFSRFTYWLVNNISDSFRQAGNGLIPGVSREDILQKEVPLPPLSEQQRIVDRIESLFAKLDEAKQKAQDALDSFETRKAAILHKAFTGELTARWRKEHGVGMESWKKRALGDITDILSSKRIYKEEYTVDGVPFFRSSEIVDLYDTGNTEPTFFISEQRYEEIKNQYGVPDVGDLLVTSVGTIGKTWIVDNRKFYYKDGNLTQVRKSKLLDMRFLQLYIMSPEFKEQIEETVSGSAYNALTIVKFKKIGLLVPSVIEQTEIVRILDDLLTKEQQAKEAAEAVLEQIDLMKKSILARAFRGELGTNDPREESSIELLKQSFLETIEKVKPKPKQVTEPKAEVIFVRKTIMEALSNGVRLTPENLKSETGLPIDDFYAQLKELIDKGSVVESRENGESYLEAENENRQTEN